MAAPGDLAERIAARVAADFRPNTGRSSTVGGGGVGGRRRHHHRPPSEGIATVRRLLHDAAYVSVASMVEVLDPDEVIVDFTSSCAYQIGFSGACSADLLLFVPTSRHLFVLRTINGQPSTLAYPWEAVATRRKTLSLRPEVEVAGTGCVVTGSGDYTDWLDWMKLQRPQQPVGRLAEVLAAPAPAAHPPAWLPDPTRRHQLRWWDGRAWTATVADNGVQAADPL